MEKIRIWDKIKPRSATLEFEAFKILFTTEPGKH
jgi:hypothetical protein